MNFGIHFLYIAHTSTISSMIHGFTLSFYTNIDTAILMQSSISFVDQYLGRYEYILSNTPPSLDDTVVSSSPCRLP